MTSAVPTLKPAQGYKGPLQMPPLLAFVPQPSYPGIRVKRKRSLAFVKIAADFAHHVVCCCLASSPENNRCASRILDGGESDSQISRRSECIEVLIRIAPVRSTLDIHIKCIACRTKQTPLSTMTLDCPLHEKDGSNCSHKLEDNKHLITDHWCYMRLNRIICCGKLRRNRKALGDE